MGKYPTQKEMEMNIAPGGRKFVNVNSMDNLLNKSKTGDASTNNKAGGKKTIDVAGKLKKIMKKKGMI